MPKGIYDRKNRVYIRKQIPIEERLWPRINKNAPNGCWEWTGNVPKTQEYPSIKFPGARVATAVHRAVYILTYGKIASGLYVCHKCDNKLCCNPDHLFLGTPQDNTLDMYAKGRDPLSNGTRYQPDVIGSNNGRALLTEADVLEIRRLGKSVKKKDLAVRFGVSTSAIQFARNYRTWKHL